MWTVENMHWYKTKPVPADAVYIGRPRRPRDYESLLGNPFGTAQNPSRSLIICNDPLVAYRDYLTELMETDTPQRREIARLAALPDGVLLCWCAPKPCHADVVAAVIAWYQQTDGGRNV